MDGPFSKGRLERIQQKYNQWKRKERKKTSFQLHPRLGVRVLSNKVTKPVGLIFWNNYLWGIRGPVGNLNQWVGRLFGILRNTWFWCLFSVKMWVPIEFPIDWWVQEPLSQNWWVWQNPLNPWWQSPWEFTSWKLVHFPRLIHLEGFIKL